MARTTSGSTSGPGPGRVGTNQAALQLGAQLDRDVAGGQRAEAGGHSVVRLEVVGQRLDHCAAASYLGPRLRSDLDRCGTAGHRDNVGEQERPRPYGNGLRGRVHDSLDALVDLRRRRRTAEASQI